ncbi:MAG: amidohydrolase family protein [Planctomycetes bacterium]|nr:amidohydrolase family protein [Planctomycetota bacterium]
MILAPMILVQSFLAPGALALAAVHAADSVPADPSAQKLRADALVLQAAEVHVGDGTVFKPGLVILLDGKVVAAGQSLPLPAGANVIDCGNAVITPGLVDAACQLGTSALFGSAEQGSEVIPQLDMWDALDLYSKDFERLVADGVTTVFITGEASSVISAKGTAVKTGGPIGERRVAVKPIVKATLGPESSQRGAGNRSPSRFGGVNYTARRPTTRMGSAWVFRKAFHDAIAFRDAGKPSNDGLEPDAMRALADVLAGKTALRMQVREALDFYTSVKLADEFGLSFTYEYATEAAQCIDLLVARKLPVIFGPVRTTDSTFEQFEAAQPALDTARLLAEKGVPFCLTASDASGEGGLPRQAGVAIRNGLDRARALRAVTSDPAAMVGLEGRVGRLAPGLDADLVVWNGMPFDDTAKPVLVLIHGRPVLDLQGKFRKENS